MAWRTGGVLASGGNAAKRARASQQSSVPVGERKQCHPPSFFWWRTSQSIAAPRPRILPVAESGEHPERVPREAHLAAAAAEVTRWAREPTEEEAYRFGDPRRLSCEAPVGEDEQPPVRRDVLRAVQLVGGAAGGHPLAFRMLASEELRGPSLPSDGFLC